MPDKFAEVNPANTAEIWTADTNGKTYIEGATNLALHSGVTLSRLDAANPQLNIYSVVRVGTPCGAYEDTTFSYSFSGPLGDSASVVNEAYVCAQIPIDDLYRQKQRELASYEDQVTYSAIEVGDPTWAWVLNVPQRLKVTDVNEGLQDRLKDITIDGDTKAYWPDGFTTNIIRQHKEFGSQKQYEVVTDVGATGWGSLMKKKGQHSEAKDKASWACGQDIDAAYDANGASGWEALSLIKVDDPKYNWPPFWVVNTL